MTLVRTIQIDTIVLHVIACELATTKFINHPILALVNVLAIDAIAIVTLFTYAVIASRTITLKVKISTSGIDMTSVVGCTTTLVNVNSSEVVCGQYRYTIFELLAMM